jgi:hypothetical protein
MQVLVAEFAETPKSGHVDGLPITKKIEVSKAGDVSRNCVSFGSSSRHVSWRALFRIQILHINSEKEGCSEFKLTYY